MAESIRATKPFTESPAVAALYNRLLDYEMGLIEDTDEAVALFQELIDTGLAWRLQGHYGRTALALIEAGRCHK